MNYICSQMFKVDTCNMSKTHICRFKIDKRIFNQFKEICKQNKTSISKELTNFIKQSIKR
jgi:hypothetical protein